MIDPSVISSSLSCSDNDLYKSLMYWKRIFPYAGPLLPNHTAEIPAAQAQRQSFPRVSNQGMSAICTDTKRPTLCLKQQVFGFSSVQHKSFSHI